MFPPAHSPQRTGRPLMARTATLSRSVGCSGHFCVSRPTRIRFYGVLAADSVAPAVRSRLPRRDDRARRRRRPRLLRRRVPRRRRRRTSAWSPTPVSWPPAGRRRAGHAAGQREGAAGPDGVGRRLLLVQRPGARPVTVDDDRRDGARDPAGRNGLPVLHAVAVALGRARDGALALPRRVPGPAPLPSAERPRAEEPVRGVAVPRSRSAAPCAGPAGAPTPTWSPPSPGTTRGGRPGSCGCRCCARSSPGTSSSSSRKR